MWIIYLMFAAAASVGGSILAGISEVNFMGPYLSQSPTGAVLQAIVVWGQSGFVQSAWFSLTHFPDVVQSIFNMFLWNYAVLDQTTIGLIIRIVLVLVVSLPLLVGFFTEVVGRLIPGAN
jgi:hypothetical protein